MIIALLLIALLMALLLGGALLTAALALFFPDPVLIVAAWMQIMAGLIVGHVATRRQEPVESAAANDEADDVEDGDIHPEWHIWLADLELKTDIAVQELRAALDALARGDTATAKFEGDRALEHLADVHVELETQRTPEAA